MGAAQFRGLEARLGSGRKGGVLAWWGEDAQPPPWLKAMYQLALAIPALSHTWGRGQDRKDRQR